MYILSLNTTANEIVREKDFRHKNNATSHIARTYILNFFFNFSVRRYKEPLNQYLYMTDLLDRNERLFYKLLSENVEELMPVVYTPTVGLACQKFGYTFTRPAVI